MPVTGTPPGPGTRLRVTLELLSGLRWRDIRSARQFTKIRFGQDAWPVRVIKLLRWALHISWRRVPDSLSWVQIDENLSRTPYWLTADNPLENHPWADDPGTPLPDAADVVVVGAGFGGASVAYHWSKRATESLVVLERDEVASGGYRELTFGA